MGRPTHIYLLPNRVQHWLSDARKFATTTCFVALATTCIFGRSANAADITDTPAEPSCTIRVNGTIEAGDAARLESVIRQNLSQPPARRETVCFDSQGGDFAEGLLMAQAIINTNQVGTAVRDGASCLSACALAFLGGVGNEDGLYARREINIGAKLGFHAPFIEPPKGQYTEARIAQAFRRAVLAVAKLAELSRRRYDYPSNRYVVEPLLLTPLLETDKNDMLYVNTIGRANIIGIEVVGFKPKATFSEADARIVCTNLHAIREPASIDGLYGSCTTGCSDIKLLNRRTSARQSSYEFGYYGPEATAKCVVKSSRGADGKLELDGMFETGDRTERPGISTPLWYMFAPSTPLALLR